MQVCYTNDDHKDIMMQLEFREVDNHVTGLAVLECLDAHVGLLKPRSTERNYNDEACWGKRSLLLFQDYEESCLP